MKFINAILHTLNWSWCTFVIHKDTPCSDASHSATTRQKVSRCFSLTFNTQKLDKTKSVTIQFYPQSKNLQFCHCSQHSTEGPPSYALLSLEYPSAEPHCWQVIQLGQFTKNVLTAVVHSSFGKDANSADSFENSNGKLRGGGRSQLPERLTIVYWFVLTCRMKQYRYQHYNIN
jgi:hypothetical protein